MESRPRACEYAERGILGMAENKRDGKCGRETCGCPPAEDSDYCGRECEDAAKVHMMEIGCTCHHPECG